MSAPPLQQRSRGPKSSSRLQVRYVPRRAAAAASVAVTDQSLPSESKPTPPLTTSLRSRDTAKPSPPDEVHPAGADGSFVRYLPQDEAVASGLGADAGGLDAVESQAVVDFLNDELSRLLRMKPKDFWREVAKNDSLHQFLDSYLQFRSRWYDFPHRGPRGMVAGVIVGEIDLCRRVFFILYRISSNRDPGARASDCLSIKDHTALLQEKKLLDLPKLLDICAIYGYENEELVKSLVTNAIKAQPQFLDHLGSVISHFLSIVHTMHERSNTSLELLSSHADHGGRFLQLLNDYLEVMDFINDAIVTFDAFVDAYKPAALYFSDSFETSYGNDELLSTLARLHDSLIPSLLCGFSFVSNSGEGEGQTISGGLIPDIVLSLKMLSMRIVKFGWKLLDFCYLNDELTEDYLPQSTTKMLPASVEDPLIRGDILVQTLKEINVEAQQQLLKYQNLGTFAENIEKNYKVFSRINSLCSHVWILLDEEQLRYLCRILKSTSSISSPSASTAVTTAHINPDQVDEDAVLFDSKICQIQDLFPDYGKGFLKACLQVYNHDTEEVIQRILEGTLHEDLLSLDTSFEHIPESKQISNNVNDKGKAVLIEPWSQENWTSAHLDPKVQGVDVGGSSTSSRSFGRYTRKSKNDISDSEVLDSRPARDAVKSAILAAEIEYEDEYDDSYDDLGLSVAESGFEETENLSDTVSSQPGKYQESDQSLSSRWNSQKKPQFYVKDGKNYSYKVSGSVGVASAKEAVIWNQAQKGLIHGLGRGGNLPLGAAQKLADSEKEDQQATVPSEDSGSGNSGFRGRGGRSGGNYHRKDRAMKKHFSGLRGY